MLCPTLSRGGGGLSSAVIPLAENLAREADVEVELVTLEAPERAPDGVAVRAPRWRGKGWLAAIGLSRLLRDGAYDLVHSHGLWTPTSLAAAHWGRGRRGLIVSPHGMIDPWALAQSRRKKQLALATFERGHLLAATCVHALTEAEFGAARAVGVRSAVAVIPNGIEPPARSAQRPALGGDGRHVMLYLGRLHRKKGLVELVEAWRLAIQQEPELKRAWRLRIAGWDDDGSAGQIAAMVTAHRLETEVELCGPLFGEEKATAFATAAAFILPSYSEGLPMALLEAWSYGLPTFATEGCNVPEALATNAAIPISTDPASLADTLAHWLPQTERLAGVGRAGMSLATAYAWPAIVAQWLPVYRWAAGLQAEASTALHMRAA